MENHFQNLILNYFENKFGVYKIIRTFATSNSG